MKLIVIAIVVGVLGVCAALVLWFLPGKPPRSKSLDTLGSGRAILLGIKGLESEDLRKLSGEIEKSGSSPSINRHIAAMLSRAYAHEPSFTKRIAPDGLLYDGWKTLFLFCGTNAPWLNKLHPDLRENFHLTAVWSAGKNKTNEYGFGDDIKIPN